MIVYCHTTTPRLHYVTHFLAQYFQQEVVITAQVQQFSSAIDVKINYSSARITEHEIWIKPVSLLFRTGTPPLTIDCFTNNHGNKAFFTTEGDIGFDLLAAIFYLLSRYEEYGTFQKDIYGRYAHQNSLAYKNNFLHLPLINIWLETFRQFIQQKFPNYKLQITNFKLLPTYDIDIAWSYRHKGFMRNAGGTIKSVVSGQWSTVRERVDVLMGRKKDPYDCYDWLDDIHQQYYLKPLYFFLVGQKRNRYDKNIPATNAAFQQLVQHIAQHYHIGLHPSWQSGIEPEMLMREKKILEEITG
ncbi:MAG: hypothetical protein ICV79_29645, partial [Flavisolibacter sp.]|nr:hypothetical protein [Flavisolibacter sp.]